MQSSGRHRCLKEIRIGLNLIYCVGWFVSVRGLLSSGCRCVKGWKPKMSKVAQMRELSAEQLVHELRETQQSLFKLRFQAASERNDVPSNARKLRRTIARIKTLQRERELSQA